MHGVFILGRDINNLWELSGEFGPCELTETSTCFHGAELKLFSSIRPILIRLGPGNLISVDNHSIKPPYLSESIQIFGQTKIYLRVSNHLELFFEPSIGLTIQVDGTQKNELSGLCGNFNNNAGDDMKTSSNIITPKLSSFVSSWAKNDQFLFHQEREERGLSLSKCSNDYFSKCHLLLNLEKCNRLISPV